MPDVFKAARPREDVLKGELRDEIFAARLEDVVSDRADPVYQDPIAFFANTYPTGGMRALLTEALGRATGKKPSASPVIRLETAFGGGKTHNLIALYHLARQARPIGVEQFVDPDVLSDQAIRIPTAVGTALEPATGVNHGGVVTHTLWGELAYQAGVYGGDIRQADEDRVAPGTHVLAETFGDEPTIVLIDELARYLTVAEAIPVEKSTLADQTLAFLMALLEHASSAERFVVVYTLATGADAFSKQTANVQEVLQGAKAISARVEHVITPTAENEIAGIVRHRLFDWTDPGAAAETARAYHEAISGELGKGSDLPANAGTAGYATDLENDYPFHPELLRVLNEKVSTIPNFQKTRGALRLLARVVRELWDAQPPGTLLIHPHHIDLSEQSIVDDLTSRLDRPVFKQVVEADIANPKAAANAHAAVADAPLTAAGKPPYASRIATTTFLHSLVQGIAAGLTPTEAKLSVFTPGDDLGLIERQLDALLETAWFFDFAGNRLRFSTEPSLVKIVADEMSLVGTTAAKGELDQRIKKIWQKGTFAPEFFPAEPSDVDDTYERPQIVVMHYDACTVSGDAPAPPELVIRIFDRSGTAQNFRTYRNQLTFLVADDGAVDHAVNEAKRYLAIQRIVGDPGRLSEFGEEHKRRLKRMAEESELTLRIAITRMYRVLYYPDAGALEKNGRLSKTLLPPQDQGDVQKDQSQVVLKVLKDVGKVLTADDNAVAPKFVREKAWPANAERATPLSLRKEFASRIGLKVLLDLNKLKETIKLGIRNGTWLYYDQAKGCAYSQDSTETPLVEITDDVELVVPEAAAGLPICGQPKPPAEEETCPVCHMPISQCICGTSKPGQTITLKAIGAPGQAFQGLVDQATDQKVAKVRSLILEVAGSGTEFVRDLIAMALAVPQLPKSTVKVAMDGAFDLTDGTHMKITYSGAWDRYRALHDIVSKAKDVTANASGRLVLRLEFDGGLDAAGSEMGQIKDTFVQLSPGGMTVSAEPVEAER